MMSWFGGGSDKYEIQNAHGQPVQVEMTKPLKCLADLDRIEVKQRTSKLELLTCDCWESNNKYDVYNSSKKRIFYAHETTGCCMRQFQSFFPDCAPWDIDIDYTEGWGSGETAYKMKRDCTPCTCLCINRPLTEITDKSGKKLGSIRDPCAVCPTNMTFTIRDENDENILSAESGCCQWGICCPMPCGPCKSVEFPVKDTSGKTVGHLQKRMKGCFKMMCCSMCFEDVENYKIDFADVQDPRQKALIMALALFTDMRYFHNNEDEDDVPS